MAFGPDNRKLFIAACSGDLRVVDLGGNVGTERSSDIAGQFRLDAQLEHCFEEHVEGVGRNAKHEGAVPVAALSLSPCGRWLASGSVTGVVHVFDLAKMAHHWTVPG